MGCEQIRIDAVSFISQSRSPGAETWPLAGKSRAMKHRGLRQLLSVVVIVVVHAEGVRRHWFTFSLRVNHFLMQVAVPQFFQIPVFIPRHLIPRPWAGPVL